MTKILVVDAGHPKKGLLKGRRVLRARKRKT